MHEDKICTEIDEKTLKFFRKAYKLVFKDETLVSENEAMNMIKLAQNKHLRDCKQAKKLWYKYKYAALKELDSMKDKDKKINFWITAMRAMNLKGLGLGDIFIYRLRTAIDTNIHEISVNSRTGNNNSQNLRTYGNMPVIKSNTEIDKEIMNGLIEKAMLPKPLKNGCNCAVTVFKENGKYKSLLEVRHTDGKIGFILGSHNIARKAIQIPYESIYFSLDELPDKYKILAICEMLDTLNCNELEKYNLHKLKLVCNLIQGNGTFTAWSKTMLFSRKLSDSYINCIEDTMDAIIAYHESIDKGVDNKIKPKSNFEIAPVNGEIKDDTIKKLIFDLRLL